MRSLPTEDSLFHCRDTCKERGRRKNVSLGNHEKWVIKLKFYGSNFQFLWENSRIVLQLIEDKRTHITYLSILNTLLHTIIKIVQKALD